jgi:hypothetical protein
MRKPISLLVLILLSFVLIPSQSYAAAENVIFSACGSSCSDSYAGSARGWRRTVERSGCVSGECLKLDASPNGSRYGAGSTRINVRNVSGHDEITIVYYVKLNPGNRSLKDANIKGVRLYTSDTAYIFSTNDGHFSWDQYQSYTSSLTMKNSGGLVGVKQHPDYCRSNGGGTYDCPVRYDIQFKTKDGKEGYPSGVWRKVRYWVKLPSSASSRDGESKLWIDEQPIFHADNVRRDPDGRDTFTLMTFYPSSEAGAKFEHWLDEMTVYEGYVPPSGDDSPPPKPTPEDPEKTQLDAPKNLRIVEN